MGLFNFLKSFIKKKEENNIIQKNEPHVEKSAEESLPFKIHPDLNNLLWFGDGPRKNYIPSPNTTEQIHLQGFVINFSVYGTEEPSLITNLPVARPLDKNSVPRPPYFPSYKDLTPEQRWMYWQFLENPYCGTHDIGYVFIFYYGLERYLFSENSRDAFDVILKLRDCYINDSFQAYSGTALMLYTMVQKDVSLAESFLNSLDKKHEMNIPANLLILLKYTLTLPLTAFEIMKYSRAFSFENQRYIKNNSDMFLGFLQQEISTLYDNDFVPLTTIFENMDSQSVHAIDIPLFANMSIRNKVVRIPDLTTYTPFIAAMNLLLTNAHEKVKKHLAEMRKMQKKNPVEISSVQAVQCSETITIVPCSIMEHINPDYESSCCKESTVKLGNTTTFNIPKSTYDYFQLSEKITSAKDISKKIEYCNQQLLLLPYFVKNELNLSGDLPPLIACRDFAPKLYMRLGRWKDAECFIKNCICANAYYPENGQKELLFLSQYRRITEILLDFLNANPGYLQRNVYKSLSLPKDDNDILKEIIRWSLLIQKVPCNSTNKLYIKNLIILEVNQ